MADGLLMESIEAAGERVREYGASLLRGEAYSAALGLRLAMDLAARPAVNVDDLTTRFTNLPEGYEADFDEEGGQPNGRGVIEPSDSHEWFSVERESHHRQHITLIGPWIDGPTPEALAYQKAEIVIRERERVSREERILREAGDIYARRASEDTPADRSVDYG